jgi:cytoskeletal protein CcmA (bactofilin family)
MKDKFSILVLIFLVLYYPSYSQCADYNNGDIQTGTCSEPAGNINLSDDLTINGNLTINGDFTVGGATLIVNGTLNVTGDLVSGGFSAVVIANGGTINATNLTSALFATFTVESGGTLNVANDAGTGLFAAFTVESGGNVDIGGDFVTGGVGSTTIDGDMNVDGDFTNTGGGVVDGDGNLTVGGTYTNNGDDSGFNGDLNGAPLPVELVYFKGGIVDDEVILEWLTSSEINNEGFEVQRSGDGEHFTNIGFVPGNGNSNEEHKYLFIDSQPYGGVSFYRYRQVDFDGQFEHSPIIMIDRAALSSKLSVYPNPTGGVVNLHGAVKNIQLFDPSGRLVLQLSNTSRLEAEQQLSRYLQSAPSGTYTLGASMNDKLEKVRIVKQ